MSVSYLNLSPLVGGSGGIGWTGGGLIALARFTAASRRAQSACSGCDVIEKAVLVAWAQFVSGANSTNVIPLRQAQP